jgi:hypothetical protein
VTDAAHSLRDSRTVDVTPMTLVVSQPAVSPPLNYPTTLRRSRAGWYVSDNNGIEELADSGRRIRTVSTFYTLNDFDSYGDGGFVVNPAARVAGPLLIVTDRIGRRIGARGQSLAFNSISTLATDEVRLASDGDTVIACAVHRPIIQIFDSGTGHAVAGAFPGQDRLEALARNDAIVHPDPTATFLPSYYTGVVILDGIAFVLCDLPGFTLLRIDLRSPDGVTVIHARRPRPTLQHIATLAARRLSASAIRFWATERKPGGRTTLISADYTVPQKEAR